MKPVQRNLLIVLALLALTVGYFALTTRQAPMLPRDADHAPSARGQGCLDCHGPNGKNPRSKNHPLGEDCFRCHGRP